MASIKITPTMDTYLRGIIEGTKYIPGNTASALESRGLITTHGAASVLLTGRHGLVEARLTDAGRDAAVASFRAEHAERLACGLKSERIPALLAKRGIAI